MTTSPTLSDAQIRSIWQTTDTGDIEDDLMAFARAVLTAAGEQPALEPVACPRGHVWNDFGQLAGRNVSWCQRCQALVWTGEESTYPAAPPPGPALEPVAEIVSKFGDPEAFGEREIRVLADLSKIPYKTKLYASPPPGKPEPASSAEAVTPPARVIFAFTAQGTGELRKSRRANG